MSEQRNIEIADAKRKKKEDDDGTKSSSSKKKGEKGLVEEEEGPGPSYCRPASTVITNDRAGQGGRRYGTPGVSLLVWPIW